MTPWETVVLAFALAVDAFSVGATVGLKHKERRQLFRLSFHFGLFQALFSGLGALAGAFLLIYFSGWDHWIVLTILTFLGVRMIYSALHGEEDEDKQNDMTKGWTMVGLSMAVSIDALAAGVSLPTGEMPVGWSVALIGIVSWVATYIAMKLADRVGMMIGKRAEIIAGIVLVAIGVNTVIEHVLKS